MRAMNRGALNTALFVLIGAAGVAGMVAMLSNAGQRVDDQRTAGSLAEKVSEMHLRQNGAHASLRARVDRLGLGGCLSAARLASTAQVHEGLAAIGSLRALLAERDRDAAAEYADDRAVLAGVPAGPVRDEAMRGMAASIERMRQVREQLSKADLAAADALQAVLEWAERNHAVLHLSGDRLLVDGRRQLDELGRLQDAVSRAAQAEQAASAHADSVVDESNRTQLTLVRQFNALY